MWPIAIQFAFPGECLVALEMNETLVHCKLSIWSLASKPRVIFTLVNFYSNKLQKKLLIKSLNSHTPYSMFCLLRWSLNKWVYSSHVPVVVLGRLQPWRGILLLPWVWSILVPALNWSHRNRHLSSRQPHLAIPECLCLLFSLTDKSACPSHDQISPV